MNTIKNIVPSTRLLQLCLAWLVLAILAAFFQYQPLLQLVLFGVVVSLLLSIWDAYQRLPQITVQRKLANTLPVNSWSEVELQLSHSFSKETWLEVFDFHPTSAQVKHLPQRVLLKPNQHTLIKYGLCPEQRGEVEFAGTQLLLPSTLGLWRIKRLYPNVQQVRVYPDFAAITRYQLFATDNQVSQLGIKRKPRRGEGLEFHQLRDYHLGDSARQIDWKATVRRGKLISREYQDERDQQLVFMLDCGRNMRAQDDQLNHFDHALNAMLLLSYVAIKQGDAVGLLSFAGQQRWLPPLKTNVNAILNTVYDLQPSMDAPDYQRAAQVLLKQQRKRALVVILTKVYEETLTDLLPVLNILRRKHLVLVVNLREQAVDNVLQQPVQEMDDALSYLAASHYQQERHHLQQVLRQHGALSLDVTPAQLPVAMVNGYWEIKRGGGL